MRGFSDESRLEHRWKRPSFRKMVTGEFEFHAPRPRRLAHPAAGRPLQSN